MAPYSMKPEVEPVCVMGEYTLEYEAHQVYAVHIYVHHAHTDRTCSHHCYNRALFQSPVDSLTTVAVIGGVIA